jgi:hypothetical protein
MKNRLTVLAATFALCVTILMSASHSASFRGANDMPPVCPPEICPQIN